MARSAGKRNIEMGRRLARLRGKRTLEEVSDAVGCALQTLYYYESEGRVPDGETLLRLASHYGVTPEYLLHGGQPPAHAVAEEIEMYRRLSLSERRLVDQVAELLLEGNEGTKVALKQVVELVRKAHGA